MKYDPQSIRDFVSQVKSGRTFHEQLWTQALNFYKGNQWFSSVNANSPTSVLPIAARDMDPRPTFNRCAPAVDVLTSALLSRRMVASSLPASEDDKDILFSEFSSKYLRYLLDTENWTEKDERGLKSLLICGNVAFHVWWNPTKGRKVYGYASDDSNNVLYQYTCPKCGNSGLTTEAEEFPVYGAQRGPANLQCPFCEADVQGSPTQVRYAHEGDVALDLIPIANFFPEGGVLDFSECRRAAHVVYMNLDTLREMYPDADHVRIQSATSEHQPALGDQMGELANRIDVYTFYELPNARDPEGKMIVCTTEIELYRGPFPYEDGDNGPLLPYAMGRFNLSPDDFYAFGQTVFAHATQQTYNQFWRNFLKHFRDHFIPQWLLPQGALAAKELSPENRVIVYKGGLKPTRADPPELSSQVFLMADKIVAELNDQLGVNDVLRGEVTNQAVSGRQIALRRETALSRFDDVATRWNEMFRRICWLALSRVKQYYTEDRLVRISGEDGDVEALIFKREYVPSNHDIRVTTEVPLGGNRQENFEKVKELQQANFFSPDMPPALFKKLSEMLDMPELRIFTKLDRLARTLARSENIKLLDGERLEAAVDDDHETHMMCHNEAVQTTRGRQSITLAEHRQDHEIKARLLKIRNQSYDMMAQQQAQESGFLPPPAMPPEGQPPAQGQAQEQPGPPQPDQGLTPEQPQTTAEAAVQQADQTGEHSFRRQMGAMM